MNMFIIKSYISKENKWYNDPIAPIDYAKYFLHVEDKSLRDSVDILLHRYPHVLGFVQILYKGEEIFGMNEFGTLDSIWGMLDNLIGDFIESGEGQAFFPDYDLCITLSNYDNDQIKLAIQNKKPVILPKVVFLESYINSAIDYRETIQSIKGNNKQGLKYLYNLKKSL